MKDADLIPAGAYCYRVEPIAPDDVLVLDIERFGKDLREFSWRPGYKEVLCPYWHRTDYGMVRCEFLGVEGLDEVVGARALALSHYGTEEAFQAANRSPHFLADEVKICGVREYEDEGEGEGTASHSKAKP